jgi:hypothetical protein
MRPLVALGCGHLLALLLVEAALQHVHQVGLVAVNEPVLPADAARPEAGEIVFEGFGLAGARGGGAQAFFEQRPNLAGRCFVGVEPVLKVFPGSGVPAQRPIVAGSAWVSRSPRWSRARAA